mmetsp:Transcript_39643/g.124593  ORF Transcript_39643/g.124593 Transcript_39643/m.124593 type:complete len:362 (-) Transcript_39643:661-1746(-)
MAQSNIEDEELDSASVRLPVSRGLKIEDLADSAGQETSQLFSADALSHAISGSIGGNIAMLAFYPLDQLVIRAQAAGKGKKNKKFKSTWRALHDVIAEEGLSGLYRGLNSTLITLFAANFIYFYAFHLLRLLLNRSKLFQMLKKNLKISQAVINLSIGTIAGGINVCFVQPLWVANARLKLQDSSKPSADHYNGMIDAIIKIRREEGLFKLWAGVSSSLLLCCNPAIQFAVYETIKRFLINRKSKLGKKGLSSLEAFILGAFAKWVATITTYPLQVAQTRLRFGKTSTSSQTGQVVEYNGTLDCLVKIYKYEGKSGLFRGMETKLWHSTLISALMFLTYEKIQRLVGNAIIAKVAKKSKVN